MNCNYITDRDREALQAGQVVVYAMIEKDGNICFVRTTSLKEQFLNPTIKQHMGEIVLHELQGAYNHLT